VAVRSKQSIKVGIFGHYLPIYRKGVMEKLSSMEDIDLTVHCTENFPAGLRLIKPEEVSFKLRDIRTLLFRIPFIKKMLSFQPAMLLKILSGSYDVYILPNTMSYLDVWACLILSRILGRRVCLWGHGKGSINGTLANWLRKSFMNLADALVFYTESARDEWKQAGISPNKMFVAYNALDTEESALIRSEISESDVTEFVKVHGLENKKIIVYTGRLLVRKRPDLIVDAMVRIITRVPEAHVIIIGDGVMREEIQNRIADAKLNEHISLVGALFDEKKIAYYLMASKIAVMPAAAGLFVQHVFDYGLPIVVGDDMSTHPPEIELVADGKTGLFFEDGNAAHLAERLLELLEDEEKRLQMSSNAKKVIQTKFNVNTMAEGLSQAIRYSCGKRQ